MAHLNKDATAIFMAIIAEADKREGYCKIDNTGGVFMPVSVDRVNTNVYAIAHNGIQNGDVMADPDMTFWLDRKEGKVYPLTFQNDYVGKYQDCHTGAWTGGRPVGFDERIQADLATFANQWMVNIADQQSIKPGLPLEGVQGDIIETTAAPVQGLSLVDLARLIEEKGEKTVEAADVLPEEMPAAPPIAIAWAGNQKARPARPPLMFVKRNRRNAA